jgi:hypothetical protein
MAPAYSAYSWERCRQQGDDYTLRIVRIFEAIETEVDSISAWVF